jgi:uncharacterized protein YyaL (SSP411 family)
MPTPFTAIRWLPWGTEAFSRAQSGGRPVLLSLVTSWSAACQALDRDVFSDPGLARAIEEAAVPIRVDADRRPDLAERYTQGGWPTTLFLTPEGDLLAGCAWPDAARLTALVTGVAAALRERRQELALLAQRHRASASASAGGGAAAVILPAAPAEPDPAGAGDAVAASRDAADEESTAAATLSWIADRVVADFDPDHGGFSAGDAGKFPLAAPLAFALWQGARIGDARLLDVAFITLDRMAAGALSAADGAFHRGCARRDWSEPDEARLLETQAELIPLYLDAWALTGVPGYRARAESALGFVDRTLRDPARGGFFASQAPDGSIDRVLLTDANAKMIGALLRAGRVFEDTTFLERAAQAIERLVPAAYQRQAGVAHIVTPADAPGDAGGHAAGDVAQVRGLLADQVHASAALLETGLAVGEPVYVELAEELMRGALRKLWRPGAGLADRIRSTAGAGNVGLLADPLYPFATNAAAARVLIRLGRDANRADLLESAHATLKILGHTYREQGMLSAELGLALLTLG